VRAIRWDRIGRIALLCVLAGVVYLYIGPTRTWISTYHQAKERKAVVAQLREENHRLRARRDALRRSSTVETEARRLGMVRAGEKAYVVRGLPR
jgi:cell division protein FtsB